MKKILTVSILALLLSACGSNNRETTRIKSPEVSDRAKVALADKSSDEKVICKQVKKIGSNRITTVCQSASEIKEIRETTQREMRRGPQSGPSGEAGGR